MDFQFEDDIFESKLKDLTISQPVIDSYKAKIVDYKTFLDESEDKNDAEELINLKKLKADYYYFKNDYQKAIDLYQSCLDLSGNSLLKNTLFQRELEESIINCSLKLNNYELALKKCDKLLSTCENYDHYTSSLNLKLKILSQEKQNKDCLNDEIIFICLKLLILHPFNINLWIKSVDHLLLTSNKPETNKDKSLYYYQFCVFIVYELLKHVYKNRSEIITKQKTKQQTWFDNELKRIETFKLEKIPDDIVSKKLEAADKLNDNEKLDKLRECINIEATFNYWFN